MKHLLVRCIRLYQLITRPLTTQGVFPFSLSGCRSWPTCSDYSISMIERYGVARGSYRSMIRLLHCHPLNIVR